MSEASSPVGKIPDAAVGVIAHINWRMMLTDRVALFGYTPRAQNRIGFGLEHSVLSPASNLFRQAANTP